MPTKDPNLTQIFFKMENGEFQPFPQPQEILLETEDISRNENIDCFKNMEVSFEIDDESSKRLNSFFCPYFDYADQIYEFFKRTIWCNNWRKMHHLPIIRRRGKRK